MPGLTRKDFEDIGAAIAPLLKRELEKLEAKFEVRIADLETKALRYCGVWQASQCYKAGSVVTMDGALFATGRDSVAERPMTTSGPNWQMIVKAGSK